MAMPIDAQGRAGTRTPGRPKAEEGRDTRADLLRVARELFAAKGYAGTSVNEVGAGATVSVPVIYQRFGSKAGLFVAVAEDVYTRGLSRLRESIVGASTFDEAADAALRVFASLYQIDPTLGAMVVTVLVEAERHEELRQALQPTLRELRSFCDDVADLASESLAPNAERRRDLSRALVALFSGIMISSVLLHRAPEYEAMVAAMRRMLQDRSDGLPADQP